MMLLINAGLILSFLAALFLLAYSSKTEGALDRGTRDLLWERSLYRHMFRLSGRAWVNTAYWLLAAGFLLQFLGNIT